ncbi:unnamed protein product [Phytophthora lilii]|uniref:Unnamed protein product n=1 Tax=Phytophthora lilii TaxID=2077276 RepID=A0A9W6TJ21_9STRA|nr:unnamed protein product [Phytophthora lilii]
MKTTTFISMCACAFSAVTLAPAPITARPMHAGIDYQRYLAEKDYVQNDFDGWWKKHGAEAETRGFLPSSRERSTEDLQEDMRQRIFLSKQDVERAQAANPNANFSLDVVYSILTKEEFANQIKNSFAQGNNTLTRLRSRSKSLSQSRKLRTQYDFVSNAKMLNKLSSGVDSSTESGTPLGESMVAAKDPMTAMSAMSALEVLLSVVTGPPTSAPCDEEDSTKQQSVPTTTPEWTKAPTITTPVWTKAPTTTTEAPATATPATTEEATQTNSVDWTTSACMSPIQNQGQCGDCWAFATAAAVESAQCIAGGQKSLNKFSEQQLVSCNTQNNGCNGGAPQYAFDYILENGFCMEDTFPYASSEGMIPSCVSCTRTESGIKGYNVLEVGDEAGLVEAINERPTVVTVAAGNEAWKQYTGGVLSSCDTSALDHLVLAVATTQRV